MHAYWEANRVKSEKIVAAKAKAEIGMKDDKKSIRFGSRQSTSKTGPQDRGVQSQHREKLKHKKSSNLLQQYSTSWSITKKKRSGWHDTTAATKQAALLVAVRPGEEADEVEEGMIERDANADEENQENQENIEPGAEADW